MFLGRGLVKEVLILDDDVGSEAKMEVAMTGCFVDKVLRYLFLHPSVI